METLQKIYAQKNLNKTESKEIATKIFNGELSEAEMGAVLMALKIKGETAEELAGFAETLREKAVQLPINPSETICNCGTGGDGSDSFNVSTTASFVLASGGLKVAKTGNRSISSRSGSFDTCEALGIEFLVNPEVLGKMMKKTNLAFIFAPHVHPSMKYIMPTRKSLKVPTLMNLIGPLTNPVALDYQLMGTYRNDLLVTTAETIKQLGRKRAIVITGAAGMDEATLFGENHYALLADDKITVHAFKASDYGLKPYTLEEIRGGDAKENAKILLSVLRGKESPYFETVVLNAGLGFFASGKVISISDGIKQARELLLSGKAYEKLQEVLMVQKEESCA